MINRYMLFAFFDMDLSSYELRAIHKLLMICLIIRSDSSRKVDISLSDMMAFCSSSKPTIISALKHLEDLNFISSDKNWGAVSSYSITLDLLGSGSDLLLYLNGDSDSPPTLKNESPDSLMKQQEVPLELTSKILNLTKSKN